MPDLPMQYHTAYEWQGNAADGTTTIESHHPLPVGTPHDLDRYSPEHLLVVAAETCLANYVLLIAELSKLTVSTYRSQALGDLEQDEERLYRFKRILIRPEVTFQGATESLARKIVEKAHRMCLIARSINCPVDIEPTILVSQ